jgi:predicted MPP superfamily phosphohydrolase
MWVERARTGARLVVAQAGAVAVWAFVVNRTVMNWVDGPLKTATLAVFACALGALGVLSASWTVAGRRGAAVWAWAAALVLFGFGEAHRAWLRSAYHARTFEASPFQPITTTELELRRFTLELPSLGEAQLRVVALSDLHVTPSSDAAYAARVHGAVRTLDPDFVFLTGDFVSRAERVPLLARWLEGLPRGRHGSFAVLGNHDHWTGRGAEISETLERAGIGMLRGSCVNVAVSGAPPVRVCGTEEPWGPALAPPFADAAVSATLVLSHTPDNVYTLASQGATAVFAGHTHGGQWRIPLFGALVIPSRYGRRFDQGHFAVEGTHLFVSAGVGADAPNLRLWCPPDLVVVELVGSLRSVSETP